MGITIFGALGLPETDASILNNIGQEVVYGAVARSLEEHNAEVLDSMGLFVERRTPDWKLTYKLDNGGGYLQRKGPRSNAAEVKPPPGWDAALPLEDFGAGFAADRITFAYMTVRDLNRVVRTVQNQDKATVRLEMLRAIFNNTQRVFKDDLRGDLTVMPLANNDTVIYPALVGSDAPTRANAYLGVPLDATAITDANNPLPKAVDTLEGHFGTPSGGSAIVVFFNNAQTQGMQHLAGFEPVVNRYVTPGIADNRVDLENLPPLPGRIIGVSDGAILVEWRQMPPGYLLGVHLEAPPPLLERVDTEASGLLAGLQLIAEDFDNPFWKYEWSHRFGFGAGNRLNGAVIDLTAAGGPNTYTVPARYA